MLAPRSIIASCIQACRGFSTVSGTRRTYDVLVVGCGAFGSAAFYHLAKRGDLKVGAIEQFSPGHSLGSSHGETRITRLAYFEGPEYVPLIKRSLTLFKELGQEVKKELFLRTGMLDIHGLFDRSLVTARLHNLEHEVLSGAEVNARYPGYKLPDHWKALYQPDGGMLRPEDIIQTQCQLACDHGGVLHTGERVVGWTAIGEAGSGGVEVRTNTGNTYVAGQLVLAAGPWMSQLVPQLKAVLEPIRQVVAWFKIAQPEKSFRPEAFPAFVIQEMDEEELAPSEGGGASGRAVRAAQQMGEAMGDHHCYYGFGQYGATPGFKFGKFNHLREVIKSADAVQRDITPADEAALRLGVTRYFPGADGPMNRASVCIFTNTPDTHFIIDRHPAHPQVLLVSACSGHGFKMSSGAGQLISDMIVHGGRGSAEIQEELLLHRINSTRPGFDKLGWGR